ncbi:MAG: hypothetical protein ACKO7A_17505, partial [Microcystis sp.]
AIVPDVMPISEQDLKVIQSIFGIDTFFATETISFQEGAIFKGNLRGEPDLVHSRLTQKLSNHFGDKYRLFLVEGTEEKPVVIILPKTNDPSPATLAQKNLSLVLLVATIVTSLEAAGIELNLAVILFLLVASTIIYIYLGNRLRLLKTNQIIEPKVNPAVSQSITPPETPAAVTAIVPDVMPISEQDLKVIQSIFGIDTFFATETISFQEGAIFKGNLRG